MCQAFKLIFEIQQIIKSADRLKTGGVCVMLTRFYIHTNITIPSTSSMISSSFYLR
jgi:hypothetical protein